MSYLVHFKGWKDKWDCWLEEDDVRAVPLAEWQDAADNMKPAARKEKPACFA